EIAHAGGALLDAGAQDSARANALDVPDDAGALGEVGIAGVLGHQRDAGAGGGGHGARASPAGADDDTKGGDLILGLNDGVGGLLRRGVHAQRLGILAKRIHQAGGWGDGIPGGDGEAAIDGAQCSGGVAGDEDLAGGFVQRHDAGSVALGDVGAGVVNGSLHDAEVEVNGLLLALEVLGEAGLDLVYIYAEQLNQRADVRHVGDVGTQVGVGARVLGHLGDGQGIVGDVLAVLRQLPL